MERGRRVAMVAAGVAGAVAANWLLAKASQRRRDAGARLGRLVLIPGAAHAINFSYPREFREAVLPFLLAPNTPGYHEITRTAALAGAG